MRAPCFALMLLCAAWPAGAQAPFSYEVCHPERAEVHAEALVPFTLEDLEAAAEAIPNATGRYWQITSEEGAVSHIWGTMHSNHPRILRLPDRVETDLRTARVVALEADYVFTSREDLQRWTLSEDLLHPGWNMAFRGLGLPFEVQEWIRARTEAIGWGTDAPETLTLAGLAALLTSDPCGDFANGVYTGQDGFIQMLGAMEGAEILGLEPGFAFVDHISQRQNMALAGAIVAVYGTYLNPTVRREDIATSQALYLSGRNGVAMLLDRAYIQEIYGEDRGRDLLALTNGYLLDERNATFLKTALPELETGGVFIAVGSFHLPGARGMIEGLRQAGFDVERVVLDGEAVR